MKWIRWTIFSYVVTTMQWYRRKARDWCITLHLDHRTVMCCFSWPLKGGKEERSLVLNWGSSVVYWSPLTQFFNEIQILGKLLSCYCSVTFCLSVCGIPMQCTFIPFEIIIFCDWLFADRIAIQLLFSWCYSFVSVISFPLTWKPIFRFIFHNHMSL